MHWKDEQYKYLVDGTLHNHCCYNLKYYIYLETLEEDHLGDVVISGRIILTSMLDGFIWLGIGASRWLL
jgi:hypothetical protein